MSTLIVFACGFLAGLIYSQGKEQPLRSAREDAVRVVRWIWLMGRKCWESVWREDHREKER